MPLDLLGSIDNQGRVDVGSNCDSADLIIGGEVHLSGGGLIKIGSSSGILRFV